MEMTFRVGRYMCKLSFSDETNLVAKWTPEQPTNLSRKELVQYRAGRDALLAEVAKAKGGGSVLVIET